MKKLLLLLIPFLFISCEAGYFTGIYEYEFKNDSSIAVSFELDNHNSYTIQPGESVNIIKDHNEGFTFINHPRVTTREECAKPHTYYYIYIEDMQYVNMKFFNSSSYDIIVSEKNNLLGNTYGDKLIIPAGSIVTSKVYTTTPAFVSIFKDSLMPADNALSVSITY